MSTHYVCDLEDTGLPQSIGKKAQNLRLLMRDGHQTPKTYVCTWDAYLRYLEEPTELVKAVELELSSKLDPNQHYAVRSSANIEDSLDHSMAGQFKTVLSVRGVEEVMQAVVTVWTSTHSPGVEAYLGTVGGDQHDLKMAVIIQEMVPPVISGVSFSMNPMTGAHEIIVEAVAGSGESLVQRGVTPERWANRGDTWTLKPECEDIPLALIHDVVAQTEQIATDYGGPLDLEWVYDGRSVYWVQLRDITALKAVNVYSNRAAKEVLPGIIKPLVWSVNVPLVNSAWVKLFSELAGEIDIDPESLAKSFYYRAYFNMSAIGEVFDALGLPRDTLQRLGSGSGRNGKKPAIRPSRRTWSHLPRLVRFIVDKWLFRRKIDAFLPYMQAKYREFRINQAAKLNKHELITKIDELYRLNQETAYYNIVTPHLMRIHTARLRRRLQKAGVDFESFDVTGGAEELQEFDPNVHLQDLGQLYAGLGEGMQAQIAQSSYKGFLELPGIAPLQQGVASFIDRFGHLSDSGNDFSSVPWRENPKIVLDMIASYPQSKRSRKPHLEDLDLSPLQRQRLMRLNRRARKFRLYREAVGSLYTYGYGLFRVYFLALGDHLVRQNLITSRTDVFHLHLEEIRAIVEDGQRGIDYKGKVAQRKSEIEAYRDVILPDIIYGDQPPPVDRNRPKESQTLKGIPTSRGYYRGPVRVVGGIEGFGDLQRGEVLVVPFSDVGWTPLFSKAGAVIAESGGLLSHSSIVAREYAIPAVVAVSGACHLENGTIVTVDGYTGTIFVQDKNL